MKSISISIYSIRIQNKETKQYLNLDSVNLQEYFEEYFNSLKKGNVNDTQEQKVMLMETDLNIFEKKEGDIKIYTYSSGIVESGEYGNESEFFDTKENKKLDFKKPKDCAELMEFYFGICIPPKSDRGLLVLEKLGPFGIKTIFQKDFKKFLLSKNVNFEVNFGELQYKEYWEKYLEKGRITKIHFIKYNIPNDISESQKNNFMANKDTMFFTYGIEAKKNRGLDFLKPNIRRAFNDRGSQCKIVEVVDIEYDKVKVVIDLNGKSKTLNLNKTDDIIPINVTEDIEIGPDGKVTYESINDISKQYMEDFLKGLMVTE